MKDDKNTTQIKPGDRLRIRPDVLSDIGLIPQIIGSTRCDVSELKKGLIVNNTDGKNIQCNHPRGHGIVMVNPDYFSKI